MVKQRPHAQGARWRKLDNTAKLFAAVAGEDLSNVFRLSAVLTEKINQEILERALEITLPEFENFRVKLRTGFFWSYFETNNRKPVVEEESTYPCKFIDPHASHRFPFRVSYYGNRINFEVFHGLTDGLGAMNFMKRLTENYLELSLAQSQEMPDNFHEEKTEHDVPQKLPSKEEDGYLRHYKERPHQRYETGKAMQVTGQFLPLDGQSVLHGSIELAALKKLCREQDVSITKYLTAALLWSLIQVYTDGRTLKNPVALNLPINLRSFFDSETMANFFSVTNIAWPAGSAPVSFEDVLSEVSRQMDEKIVKEKLEETISYNVSNEKKWYVRIVPLFVKNIAMNVIFLKSSRAYTMTLSNLGQIKLKPELAELVKEFQVVIGVSKRQRMKCGVAAYGDRLSLSFNSVLNDMRLQNYFFQFLKERGAAAELESNGAADWEHDKGTYPSISYDRGKLRRFTNILYLVLLTAAAITGVVNFLTYELTQTWWSIITIGSMSYVAMTVRYSIMRRASLAGILVRQSLGAQVLLVLIDYMTGFNGWSCDYAIPSLIIFDVIAIVFLILVNRLNWQSYFMYQLAITVFSFIPLILWAVGWITRPLMAVITVILSVAVLFVTVMLGDRSVKKELKRRFYL